MQRAACAGDRVRGRRSRSPRCWSSCGRRSALVDRIPAAAGRRARRRAGAAAGRGPGALRGRRRDAQPARRLRRAGTGRGPARRRPLARRLERPGAAVRLPAAAWPTRSRSLIAVRDGEPSLLDGADLPIMRIGRTEQRRGGGAAARALRRGGAIGCTTRPPATRWRCSSSRPTRTIWSSRPRARRCSCRRDLSSAFLRRAGELDDAARSALVLAAASDSGRARRARARRGRARPRSRRPSPRPRRAGLVTLRGGRRRVPPSARPLGHLRRCAGRGAPCRPPRARRRAARSRPRSARVAPRHRRGERGRRRLGGPRAGRRARAGAQRIRERSGGVRARRPARRR